MRKRAQTAVFKDPLEFFGLHQIYREPMKEISIDINHFYGDFVDLSNLELLYTAFQSKNLKSLHIM